MTRYASSLQRLESSACLIITRGLAAVPLSMSLAPITCLFLLLAPRSTSGHAVIAAGSPSIRGGFSEEDHEPVDAADDEPLIRGRIELVSISTPNAATLTLRHLSASTRMAVRRSQGRCLVARAQS